VQQGGLAAATFMAISNDKIDERSRTIAASAIAKTLISTDPNIAFSSKFSPLSVIGPLAHLLNSDSSDIPLLDTFESLMALTNLASLGDATAARIVTEAWTKIEFSLTVSNILVQRASVELICNLAVVPAAAQHLLDPSSTKASSNLELLAAFTDADDRSTRLAATGALAMLSEWAVAPESMGTNSTVLTRLAKVLNEETDHEVILRAVVTLSNLIVGATDGSEVSDQVKKTVTITGASDALRKVSRESKDPDVLSSAMEALSLV
jgi:hypothetical protein